MSVTVIINSFNEKRETFDRTMKSIIKARPGQIILSTVQNDNCIAWVRHSTDIVINEKPGIFSQLNKAIPFVREKYVCYASSNDIMYPHKLILEEDILIKAGKKVCYSAFDVKRIKNLKSRKHPHIYRTRRSFFNYDYKRHLQENFISDCSLIESELLKRYTPFREEYNNSAFHDLWLRIYEGEGDVFMYNPKPTWKYIMTQNSQHIGVLKDKERREKKFNDRQNMLNNHKN